MTRTTKEQFIDFAGDEPEEQDKRDAERFRALIPLLDWDGHGYWLPELCIKERNMWQDALPEPTLKEFRRAFDQFKKTRMRGVTP